MTYSKALIEFCQNYTPQKISKSSDPVMIQQKQLLQDSTSFLNPLNPPIITRIFCIQNNITQIPICKSINCHNPTKINSAYPKKGFTSYCSDQCAKQNRSQEKSFLQYLQDKNWLFDQRITQQKSKELIAQELNCSITPINKWIKIHDIPNVKFNESNPLAISKLKNYEYMFNQHITNHKSCENIANELNVSKATVSVHLAKLNIPTNESNSYDRPAKTSNECQEIVNFIKSFYKKEILLNKRNIIGSLELDIYLPEDNIAIEYNGLYSHIYRPNESSFSLRKDSKYHLYKTEQCEKQNIQLIHIFSSQWKSNKIVWQSFIKNKLNCTEHKIYARNCTIKYVSVQDKNIFLQENHIQGNSSSQIRIGLYFNDQLISIMTFGKSRYNKNYEWELARFCTKCNYNVVGGFSKLLTYFKKKYKGSIISYANRTYSNGKLYENNGFTLLKINKPSYYYVDLNTEIMYHKTNFKKHLLLQKINKPEWNEEMLALELGYNKIFDCGTKAYIIST